MMIWAGESNEFEFTEDDGDSYDYIAQKVRLTMFKWDDVSSTLSWSRSVDDYSGPGLFTQIKAILRAKGSSITSKTVSFTTQGSFKF